MKRLIIGLILVVCLLVPVSCAPAPESMPAPETAPAPEPIPIPTPTPEPTPATFTISALSISPTSVAIGEDVEISVRITNTGDLTGSYTITHKINGVTTDTSEITLDGHASATSIFTTVIEGEDAAGTYSVDINGLSGTFIVKAPTPEPMTLCQFLADNFGTCETSLGPTSFEFDIWENDSILFPYDYRILVEYDLGFFPRLEVQHRCHHRDEPHSLRGAEGTSREIGKGCDSAYAGQEVRRVLLLLLV